jgi:hypothetical protein
MPQVKAMIGETHNRTSLRFLFACPANKTLIAGRFAPSERFKRPEVRDPKSASFCSRPNDLAQKAFALNAIMQAAFPMSVGLSKSASCTATQIPWGGEP